METAYRQLADDLKNDIANGVYRPGDALPSENDLVARTNLSRTTVRNAMKLLKAAGLIDAGPGRPTTVRLPQPRIRRDGSTRYLWEKDQVARGGLPNDSHLAREVGLPVDGTELTLLTDELIDADHDLAAAFGVNLSEPLHHYVWLLSTGGTPGRIAHHYYLEELDEAVREHHPGNALHPDSPVIWPGGTMYQLAQQGVEVGRVDDLITARAALPDEIDLLKLPEGVPLLMVRKTTFDTAGLVHEVVDVLMPADRTELLYSITLPLWIGGVASNATDSE